MKKSKHSMNIQIWSDFACPFCYIGKHNLEQAIMRLSEEEMSRITIQYRSFELAPDAPLFTDKSTAEEIAERYGTTIEKAKEMIQNSTGVAATCGLKLNYEKSIPTSTFKAHQFQHHVMQTAPAKIKASADLLFKAYFEEGKNLSDDAVLLDIAEKIEIDSNEVKAMLEDERYVNAVRDDEAIAHRISITSVPFFVVNNEVAISGAQATEDFYAFLKEQLTEKND